MDDLNHYSKLHFPLSSDNGKQLEHSFMEKENKKKYVKIEPKLFDSKKGHKLISNFLKYKALINREKVLYGIEKHKNNRNEDNSSVSGSQYLVNYSHKKENTKIKIDNTNRHNDSTCTNCKRDNSNVKPHKITERKFVDKSSLQNKGTHGNNASMPQSFTVNGRNKNNSRLKNENERNIRKKDSNLYQCQSILPTKKSFVQQETSKKESILDHFSNSRNIIISPSPTENNEPKMKLLFPSFFTRIFPQNKHSRSIDKQSKNGNHHNLKIRLSNNSNIINSSFNNNSTILSTSNPFEHTAEFSFFKDSSHPCQDLQKFTFKSSEKINSVPEDQYEILKNEITEIVSQYGNKYHSNLQEDSKANGIDPRIEKIKEQQQITFRNDERPCCSVLNQEDRRKINIAKVNPFTFNQCAKKKNLATILSNGKKIDFKNILSQKKEEKIVLKKDKIAARIIICDDVENKANPIHHFHSRNHSDNGGNDANINDTTQASIVNSESNRRSINESIRKSISGSPKIMKNHPLIKTLFL